jgi:hypothetical protein
LPPSNIEYTYSANDKSVAIWESPLAFDKESNEISFNLEGLESLNAASIEIIDGNQMKITVDKS